MSRNIYALYFSATGTTEKIVEALAEGISAGLNSGAGGRKINFTFPETRERARSFAAGDVVIVGVPVIAGRVPNVLLKYLSMIRGNGALAIAVVVFGNRDYDDALIELKDLLEQAGFGVIAAGAFIGEHSFSRKLAQGRPDKQDFAVLKQFAESIAGKILAGNRPLSVRVKGYKPYRDYYKPVDRKGQPVDFRKITPRTGSGCIDCKVCADVCPMGSIDYQDTSRLNGICIKCCACVKKCPVGAKYFDDENYLKHQHELEEIYSSRKEPEIFI
ncbi:MAG: EFR1 family ferrodoxin [Clostridia bacterium]|jgi:ferredoxin|nr:EFR1 family ferrodoxin [Clostridia bacterium]